MYGDEIYDAIVSKLYIIGVYGDRKKKPDFVSCFEKWFEGTEYKNHVLGIERHKYGQKIGDGILRVDEVKDRIDYFIKV